MHESMCAHTVAFIYLNYIISLSFFFASFISCVLLFFFFVCVLLALDANGDVQAFPRLVFFLIKAGANFRLKTPEGTK